MEFNTLKREKQRFDRETIHKIQNRIENIKHFMYALTIVCIITLIIVILDYVGIL